MGLQIYEENAPCVKDADMDDIHITQGEIISLLNLVVEHQVTLYNMITEMHEMFVRFRPMIERYEQAAKAQGFRAQRAALKGKHNG